MSTSIWKERNKENILAQTNGSTSSWKENFMGDTVEWFVGFINTCFEYQGFDEMPPPPSKTPPSPPKNTAHNYSLFPQLFTFS